MPKPSSHSEGFIEDTIFGYHTVVEALRAGRRIDKILVKTDISSEIRADIMSRAKTSGVQVQTVPLEKIQRSCPRNANHQGVVAFLSLVEYHDLEDVVINTQERGEIPLLVMLDQVSDVRNFAAIARSAECLGVHAIIIPQAGAARINAEAMKISSGALNHIPVCRVVHLADTLSLLQQYGLRLVACTEKAKVSLFEADFRQSTCLIFGSEDEGISSRLLKMCDQQVSIPMQGQIGSLNVSVTVGAVLTEALRQRRVKN